MTCDCEDATPIDLYKPPKRNAYHFGMLMDVPEFERDAYYVRHMRYLGNRLGLGDGVLCGLRCTADEQLTTLTLTAGVAIVGGREVIVPDAQTIALDKFGEEFDAILEGKRGGVVALVLSYRECRTDERPVPVIDGCKPRERALPTQVVESFSLGFGAAPAASSDCERLRSASNRKDRSPLLWASSASCSGSTSASEGLPLATLWLAPSAADAEASSPRYALTRLTQEPALPLLSNARLLDLILCLWDQVDACCGQLGLREVRVFGEASSVRVAESHGPWRTEPGPPQLVNESANAIELEFDRPLAATAPLSLGVWRSTGAATTGAPTKRRVPADGNGRRMIWPQPESEGAPELTVTVERNTIALRALRPLSGAYSIAIFGTDQEFEGQSFTALKAESEAAFDHKVVVLTFSFNN